MILVYVFGLCGALLLAVGFVVQQHVAATTGSEPRLSPLILVDLARRPMWIAGLGCMVGGQVLGALALDRGSLTLVEPLLAANLLFALPLAAAWRRCRLGLREYLGAVTLIVGLAGFIAAAGTRPDRTAPVSAAGWLAAGLSVVGLAAGLTLVAKRSNLAGEATLLASGAGVLFGLQDALTQRSLAELSRGLPTLVGSWQPYALVAVAAAGLVLGQNAFRVAPLPASLPAITIGEPICGVGLGAGLFDQPIRLGAPYLFVEILTLGLMVVGVILVARSPVVTGHDRARAAVVDR
ncbi:MAG: DMT family transporter [Acidimicrobiales bacterium]